MSSTDRYHTIRLLRIYIAFLLKRQMSPKKYSCDKSSAHEASLTAANSLLQFRMKVISISTNENVGAVATDQSQTRI